MWKDSLESKKPLHNLTEQKLALYDISQDDNNFNWYANWNLERNSNPSNIVINEMEFQFDDKVMEILETCSQLEKDIFKLRYLYGLKYPEIRKELKIKAWQVKSSLHVIKNKMKAEITR